LIGLDLIYLYTCTLEKFFVEQIKQLIFTRKLRYIKTPAALSSSSTKEVMSKMMNELVQYSMSLANDSYQTSLCLQFSPQEIATACVYLACQLAKVEPVTGPVDFKSTLGDPDIDALFSICWQILDLIADKKASDVENVKKIRAALDFMKSRDGSSSAKQSQQQQQQQQQQTAPLHQQQSPMYNYPSTPSPSTAEQGLTPPPPPPTGSDQANPKTKRPRID
jgi:hypothetical protein